MRNRIRGVLALLGLASLCSVWSAELSYTNVPAAQLSAFMLNGKTYNPTLTPNDDTDIPLLLAALAKDPRGPWAGHIARKAGITHAAAGHAAAAARTNLFRQTLSYLTQGREILNEALAHDAELQYSHDQLLGLMAKAAFESGSPLGEVKGAAREMLANNTDLKSWNYGNVEYAANELLGRAALREGNTEDAGKYLLAAGKTKGSPQLNSFGPSFTLARELAEKGERDTVLQFLDLVGMFWANPDKKKEGNSRNVATANQKQLEAWKQQIQDGKIPSHYKWQ